MFDIINFTETFFCTGVMVHTEKTIFADAFGWSEPGHRFQSWRSCERTENVLAQSLKKGQNAQNLKHVKAW